MRTYEARCGRCGEDYPILGFQDTQHSDCGGFPKRIFEVHTSQGSLLIALWVRQQSPRQARPLIKYRPITVDPLPSVEPTPERRRARPFWRRLAH